jgi:hypothetical protein
MLRFTSGVTDSTIADSRWNVRVDISAEKKAILIIVNSRATFVFIDIEMPSVPQSLLQEHLCLTFT